MELYFLDKSVTPICGPIEDFLSLSYTDRFASTGEFALTLPFSLADTLQDAVYLELRGDDAPSPFTDGKKTLGRIEKTVYDSENKTVSVSGRLAESLLSDRFITRGTHVQGTVKQVVETVVTQNAIGKFAGERAIPYLRMKGVPEFLNESGALILIDVYPGGAVLETWLRELLALYGASYRITYEPSEVLEPLVLSVYIAEDRTQAQDTHKPVIFSTSLATLENATFTYDTELYRNYVFIAGEGNGEERVTLTLDRRKSADEPLRELYLDARDLRSDADGTQMSDATYQALLLARAEKRLRQYAEITRIEGTGTPTVSLPVLSVDTVGEPLSQTQITLRPGVDFSLGDLCDIALDTPHLDFSERVTAIKTEVKDGAVLTWAMFGAEYPSLAELLAEV